MSAFQGLRVSITDVIRGILDNYPAGIAVLRELLQNSDDAGATKQIFLLDRRSYHSPNDLYNPPELAKCQGPALLAINDSIFQEKDWTAIGNIHQSSKKADEYTTGKFGLGFQACYHVTDNPQIYSTGSLVVLDPHLEMSEKGGIELHKGPSLNPFRAVLRDLDTEKTTVIRLPLRTKEAAQSSKIKEYPLSPEDVKKWFTDFIETELDVGLIFLKHITSIELEEVADDNVFRCIACVRICDLTDTIKETRSRYRGRNARQESYQLKIETLAGRLTLETTWMVTQFIDDYSKVERHMSAKLGDQARQQMKSDKLLPHVGLALPMANGSIVECEGKLFTLLPLPIPTKFPLHIHSVFALMSDRQRLRNPQERVDAKSREKLLIEWNRYIFSSIVPQAWAHLLQDLANTFPNINIYAAWPWALPISNTGDEIYWVDLPGNLLKLAALRTVWPILKGGYFRLDAVMVSDKSKNEQAVIGALVDADVPMSEAPHHIVQLIDTTPGNYRLRILVPRSVYPLLKARIQHLYRLDKSKRRTLLDYMASGLDLQLLSGLPLFQNIGGKTVVIDVSNPPFLANREEADLFRSRDPNMLLLDDLTLATKQLIHKSEKFVRITPGQILKLLQEFRAPGTSPTSSTEIVNWLCQFWKYLTSLPSRMDIKPLIRDLSTYYIVPDHRGVLHRVSHRVLSPQGTPATWSPLTTALDKFGVPFLHPTAGGDAATKRVMNNYRIVANLEAVPFLVERINVASTSIDLAAQRHIHGHLETYVPKCHLTDSQRALLRRIPIFPIVPPGPRASSPEVTFGPAEAPSNFVDSNVPIIPSVDGVHFLDATQCPNLMTALKVEQPLNEIDLLKMTLDEEVWTNQTPATRVALLDRIANRFSDIIEDETARERIRQLPLIDVGGGRLRKPIEVVDPSSKIAELFDPSDQVLPIALNDQLLQRLRENDMIQHSLTRWIIEDRIQLRDEGRSIKLLKVVDDHFRLKDPEGKMVSEILPPQFTTTPWIFTSKGFYASNECRGYRLETMTRLYDLVIPVVPQKIRSAALRRVMNWGDVSLEILVAQLHKILDLLKTSELTIPDASGRIETIIQELAKCTSDGRCSSKELEDLRISLADKQWIPTDDDLKAPRYCLLDETGLTPLSGFARVPSKLRNFPQVKKLLVELGVQSSISKTALLEAIEQLEHKVGPTDGDLIVKCAVDLMTELLKFELGDGERRQLRIPIQGPPGGPIQFAPIGDICYDNSESRTVDENRTGIPFAHPGVSKDLAEKLKLNRWSDMEFGDLDDAVFSSFDVHEDLTTRIKNLLNRGYTINSSCNEWVANAVDAEASAVSLYLNDFSSEIKSAPSPSLASYFNGPTLVVHNTSLFSDEDFVGLRSVGLGSKADKPSTIGRFGLGVVSFYHFGDIIMVISGDSVVFIDPSEQHLPRKSIHQGGGKRAGLKMKLLDCWGRYPDIFTAVQGIEDFDPSTGSYDGTIFLIPLRTPLHPIPSKISTTVWTTLDIKASIFPAFFDHAEKAFFFSSLDKINAFWRRSPEDVQLLWSVGAHREDRNTVGGMTSEKVLLSTTGPGRSEKAESSWLRVSHKHPLGEHSLFASQYGLPDPIEVSIAFQLTQIHTMNYWMFACLPLPVPTDLPFHLDSRWILSDDRRNLRLESSNERHPGPDTKFNKWLLSSVVPPLVLRGISVASRDKETRILAQHLWPKRLVLSHLSDQLIADGVHSLFLKSDELVCHVGEGEGKMMRPRDVVFGIHGNHSIRRLLSNLLPNFATLPPSIDIHGTNIKTDTPELVRTTLLHYSSKILNDPTILGESTIKIDEIVSYLVQGDKPLVKLPLLRLHNRELSCFADPSQPSVFVFNQDLVSLFNTAKVMDRDGLSAQTIEKLLRAGTTNLRKIDAHGVKQLLRDGPFGIVPCKEMRPRDFVSARSWLQGFWSDTTRLRSINIKTDLQSLLDLPLLPTLSGRLISLASCGEMYPFWRSVNNEQGSGAIAAILSRLGAPIIDLPQCTVLKPFNISANITLDRVLSILAISNRSANSPQWPVLAQWIKKNIRSQILPNLLSNHAILNNLPIWEACQPNQSSSQVYKGMSEVMMLPLGIDLSDVEQYMRPGDAEWYTAHNHLLEMIINASHQWRKMSSTDVFRRIQWPESIAIEEAELYQRLLILMRDADINALRNTSIFPNGSLQLCKASSLYDHESRLYQIAFTHQPDRFLHPLFHALLPWVSILGLKSTVSADGYMTAVTTIDYAIRGGLSFSINSINSVFAVLNRSPQWIFGQANHGQNWERIRRLRFVRRQATRSPYPPFEGSANSLEIILSLDQLVLEEFSPVCWTQRAFFIEEPTEELRSVFQEIGKPSVEEVIKHLSVLAFAARSDRMNAPTLLSDLKATYSWLNQRSDETRHHLSARRDEPLFLNQDADVPDLRTCQWRSAREMWRNVARDDDDHSVYPVKTFLEQFDNLLDAAGVRSYPSRKYTAAGTPQGTYINNVHANLVELREEGTFTDIALIPKDGKKLKAHRVILAGGSPYFKTLFTGGFRESYTEVTSESHVPDHSAEEVRLGLQYIYTGDFDPPVCGDKSEATLALEILLNLLDLGNRWEIDGLKSRAEKAVVDLDLVTPMTVDQIILRCEEAEADGLHQHCIELRDEANRRGWQMDEAGWT